MKPRKRQKKNYYKRKRIRNVKYTQHLTLPHYKHTIITTICKLFSSFLLQLFHILKFSVFLKNYKKNFNSNFLFSTHQKLLNCEICIYESSFSARVSAIIYVKWIEIKIIALKAHAKHTHTHTNVLNVLFSFVKIWVKNLNYFQLKIIKKKWKIFLSFCVCVDCELKSYQLRKV